MAVSHKERRVLKWIAEDNAYPPPVMEDWVFDTLDSLADKGLIIEEDRQDGAPYPFLTDAGRSEAIREGVYAGSKAVHPDYAPEDWRKSRVAHVMLNSIEELVGELRGTEASWVTEIYSDLWYRFEFGPTFFDALGERGISSNLRWIK